MWSGRTSYELTSLSRRSSFTRIRLFLRAVNVPKKEMGDSMLWDWFVFLITISFRSFIKPARYPMEEYTPISLICLPFLKLPRSKVFHIPISNFWEMDEIPHLVQRLNMSRNLSISPKRSNMVRSQPSLVDIMRWIEIKDGRG